MNETPDPGALRAHYQRFLRPDRVLLTGHSHQAWPDVARDAVLACWDDAAADVDDKWAAAAEAADAVRAAVAAQLGGAAGDIALAPNTHELVTRFLSAVDLRTRPHVVTTAGEFHSMRRQLTRLAEEGLEVTWIDPQPLDTLSERVAAAVCESTAAVMMSTVLFETASVVPHLEAACERAQRVGAPILLDAYHHFSVVPFEDPDPGAFVVGGGYKYAQWGEGACFLRVPAECALRPVYTGWFADFAGLADPRGARVGYGERPADRFAGSTYDPVSHYRARRVSQFFAEQGLDVATLRAINLRQTDRLIEGLEALGLEVLTPAEPERRGGFVSVRRDDAVALAKGLREASVFVDARTHHLRFGPAPYTTDDEIERALEALRPLL